MLRGEVCARVRVIRACGQRRERRYAPPAYAGVLCKCMEGVKMEHDCQDKPGANLLGTRRQQFKQLKSHGPVQRKRAVAEQVA